MKKTIFTLFALAIIFIATAQKQVKLISSTVNETVIEVKANNFNLLNVNTPNGTETVLESKSASSIQKQGAPDLAKYSEAIIIPNDQKMAVEIIDAEYEDIPNIFIAPSKGVITRNINPNSVPYQYGIEYSQDKFFPENTVSLSEPFIMRDVRGISVKMYPYQYNPVTKTLRVYKTLKIKVYATGQTDNVNVLVSTRKQKDVQVDFAKVYATFFLNATSASERYTPTAEGTPGRMLIIAKGSFMSEMQAFVNWKNQKGIFTEMVDVADVGNTSSAIKTYVQTYYNNHSDFSYLLLVGDNAQVKTSSTSAGDSDNKYGYISGNDHFVDIFVGRFSAETTAQVKTQVERTIFYEKSMTTSAAWLEKGLGIASNEGGGGGDDGESDIQHMNNIKPDLTGYNYTSVANVYQGQQNASDISSAINNGIGIVNYCGHGDTQMWASVTNFFSNTNVNALTNMNKLPFIFSVACVVGDFKNNTCFSEAWQRATNNGKPTGAIANIGSTINQSWAAPMCAQDEMVDVLTESYNNNIKRTFGGIIACGWGQMIDEYNGDGENMTDTWVCFGDASVMIRTKKPSNMTISHASGISLGATSFNVSCNKPGALVSITKDNVILGTAYASGGSANVSLSPAISGTGSILVTVTAYNKVTYQETVNILQSSNPPVCDFSGNPTTITVGESVTFTDLSTESPSSWSWSFQGADVTSSTQQNPIITYSTPGTYNVTLNVGNVNGNDSETKNAYITVNPVTEAPVANFSANNTTVIIGASVTFTDLSTNGPSAWSWSFDGGTPNTSTAQNPTIVYNTAGTYEVSLTASNSIGADTETKTAYITVSTDYCDASATITTDGFEYISKVELENINKTSLSSGYSDFTSEVANITKNTETATITITAAYQSDKLHAWIDWNKDGDFTDANEQVCDGVDASSGSVTFNVAAPSSFTMADNGNTRMRIRLEDSEHEGNETPCGDSKYGEVEDYTIHIDITQDVNNIAVNNFNIYPNPNNGVFNIETTSNNSNIKITDISGKVVFNNSTNKSFNTIDLSSVKSGIYFIEVSNNEGRSIKKIIIN